MSIFTQIVLPIGRVTPAGVILLGTGFMINRNGLMVTTRHVIGNDDKGLCALEPRITDLNVYQDTSDTAVQVGTVTVREVDPVRDLAMLQTSFNLAGDGTFPKFEDLVGGFDTVGVGDMLGIFGYPHATDGRRILTLQTAVLGAKVLLESQGIKSKYGIINNQARPGQSGSLVYDVKSSKICGVLIGAYASTIGGSILTMGINPAELHQTTHCISAEYIRDMI